MVPGKKEAAIITISYTAAKKNKSSK